MRPRWLLSMALALGCGGGPTPRPVVDGVPGMLPAPVGWAVVQPAEAEAALDALDARLSGDRALGAAWGRARAATSDWLAEHAPSDGPDPWAAWGLDRDAPIRVMLAAPDASARGRSLLAALEGGPVETPGGWGRVRAVARPRAGGATALVAGLDRLAAGLGWLVEPRGGDRWRARDPISDSRARLRLLGPYAVLELALGGPVDPLAEPDDAATPWPTTDGAPIEAGVVTAGLAALEVALGASTALARVEGRASAAARPVLRASAELLAACAGRWDTAAGVVDEVRGALALPDGRPRAVVEAQLTARGAQAWAAAARALPLDTLDGLPAAAQAGVAPAVFAAESGVGAGWFVEVAGCAAGPGAWALAPALWPAIADALPGPAPPGGWPGGVVGVAAAVPGVADGVPTLAALRVVGADGARAVERAAQDAGLQREAPGVWSLGGDAPLAVGALPGGAVVVGVGSGAFSVLRARWSPGEVAPRVLDGRLDPAALGALLDGSEALGGAAVVAQGLGALFGVWRIDGAVAGRVARTTVAAGAELDRPRGAK